MMALQLLKRRTWLSAGMLTVLAGVLSAQTESAPVRYTALAVNMGSPARWTTLTVEMVVNRWSTDAERDRLMAVLMEKGADALLETLRDMPRVGYIRTPDSIGYDLHFARRQPSGDGGERVVLATDRYISFWEATNRPRTVDYPFTVIDLRIGPNGEGEGKMSLFAKIIPDKESNTIVLEDYGTQLLEFRYRRAFGVTIAPNQPYWEIGSGVGIPWSAGIRGAAVPLQAEIGLERRVGSVRVSVAARERFVGLIGGGLPAWDLLNSLQLVFSVRFGTPDSTNTRGQR